MKNDYILKLREYFPILRKIVNGYPLVYLDNAAITQVPINVINSLSMYYKNINANVHRGVYFLSEESTRFYEETRYKVKKYINARFCSECIFVKNTTEGINLVANSYVKMHLKKGDEILISEMEHHSNIVPWFLLSKEVGAILKVVPLLKSGDLDYEAFEKLLSSRTKIISITHISNSIGTVNNIKYIIDIAHKFDIPVLIDGAQSLLHGNIDVQYLNCDFFTMSSHKMYGPSGVGILYVRKEILEGMVPYQGGGDMIKHVSFDDIIWNDIPYKFEAGTPSIANIVAFGETLKFFNELDLDFLYKYKAYLCNYLCGKLLDLPGIKIIGNPINRTSIVSFVIDGIHSHDFGTFANYYGIAVRTGHHCSIPLMKRYNLLSTIRVSLGFYNMEYELDKLVDVILKSRKIFK